MIYSRVGTALVWLIPFLALDVVRDYVGVQRYVPPPIIGGDGRVYQ